MSTGNPIYANKIIAAIDDTAADPSIAFGGGLPGQSSGTGIYGTGSSLSLSILGVQELALSASALTLPTNNLVISAGDITVTLGAISASAGQVSGARLALVSHDVVIIQNAGVPDATVGAAVAGPGSICIDYTNSNAYINAGSKATPSWKLITRAA